MKGPINYFTFAQSKLYDAMLEWARSETNEMHQRAIDAEKNQEAETILRQVVSQVQDERNAGMGARSE